MSGVKFRELLPRICNREVELCDWEMYRHQKEGLEKLLKGQNIVLVAETGSGKTEIWVSYALERLISGDFRALAIYPTKALTGDQLERIVRYAKQAGLSIGVRGSAPLRVIYGDVLRYDGDVSKWVKDYMIQQAKIVVTNPEIIHQAIYRGHRIELFLRRVDLVVVDELDFYGSARAALLLHMLKLLQRKYGVEPQLVVMGATLGDPHAVSQMLGAEIIEGRAYRPLSNTYILYPRRISELCVRTLGRDCGHPDDLKMVILEHLKSAERIKLLITAFVDWEDQITNIIRHIISDGKHTLIFTRSISDAERIGKALGIPTHHHLVERRRRHEIEAALREGRIRAVATVRTLLQGIDIGSIVRVVHVGLTPGADVKTFIQREGRAGRRPDIPETESYIIPLSFFRVKNTCRFLNMGAGRARGVNNSA
jgi:DEAD/DEAH box helicase domain-containing protein